MEKLNFRIQRANNLNDIYVSTDPEHTFNSVSHLYNIVSNVNGTQIINTLYFQKGPRKEPDSVHGVCEMDLLEIARHRIQGHQASHYATREGAMALTKLEEAIMWLTKRADDRFERGVLGTTEK